MFLGYSVKHSTRRCSPCSENKAYTLIKYLKHLITYVVYSNIVSYVPHSTIKNILAQQDFLGTRGTWVSKIQEYDLEIKPTKLVKVQGLD
jgi:hypothetical protein